MFQVENTREQSPDFFIAQHGGNFLWPFAEGDMLDGPGLLERDGIEEA